MRSAIFGIAVLLTSGPVWAAPTPARLCESAVELASAKYAQCRLTAESTYSKSGNAGARTAALAKCSQKLSDAFSRATLRYGAPSCTGSSSSAYDAYLSQCSDEVAAAAVAGGALPSCGNGTIDVVGEQCDGADLGGETCASLGYALGGTLSCDAGCGFDTSGCARIVACGQGATFNPATRECEVVCGNTVLDPGEQCEVDWSSGTVDLGGRTCSSEGFASGILRCAPGCVLDTSGCHRQSCGDGIVDLPEECDGAALAGQTCATLGYVDGELSCTGSCLFDVTACENCAQVLQEDWNDGDDAGWNGWQGTHVISGGTLTATRTESQWAASSWDFPSTLGGSLRLSATMSLVEPSSRANLCLVNSAAPGLITYIKEDASLVRYDGYCIILTDETAWGSPVGVHVIPNQNVANDTDLVPILASSFTPVVGQPYRILLTRDATGLWELFVDDVSAGTAVHTRTTSWNALTINAGADGNVGGGGVYDDIVLKTCPAP